MKKYFTTYIEVDEGMKDGDWVRFLPKEPGHPYEGRIFQADLVENGWIEEWGTNRSFRISACQKVKLFLLTTDIQEGDQIWDCVKHQNLIALTVQQPIDPHDTVAIGVSKYMNELNIEVTELYPVGRVGKIVGEVSPDALTYVSDKEKYDEEDIKIFIKSWALGWIPYEPEFSLFSEDTEGPPYEYQIRIKGPCGHFH